MVKIYNKRTRDIDKGKDGTYRLWVQMSTRKLNMIDNSKLHHVKNPEFSTPVWVLAAVSKSKSFIVNANNKYAYKEEWKAPNSRGRR